MPEINTTRIPAPRVNIIDPRTGLMSREWFLFFSNLYNLADNANSGLTLDDVQLGPPDSSYVTDNAVLQNEIDALAVAPVPEVHAIQRRYGTFYDTTTQTAAAINTAYAITYNTTDLTSGVYLGTPTSRVYVDRLGIYNFQFSLQLVSTNASVKNVYIWADVNGTSMTNSATKITLKGSSEAYVAAWNFVYRLNAGDYFRLMWSTDDTNVQILASSASSPYPGIPSVLLSVTNNIGD